MSDYCSPDEVAVIRVYQDSGQRVPGWHIDGMSLDGRFTEACYIFDTEEIARAEIPTFMKENGIIATTVVIEESSKALAEKIRSEFRRRT